MSTVEDKQLTLYANLMDEVKVRFSHINTAATGRTGFATPIIREFCYLQIRFLCELIALSCLVAHGDMQSLQSHKLGRSYSADEILNRMVKLRPHFYPIAVKQVPAPPHPSGQRSYGIEGITNSPLPRETLMTMYANSHKYLHRGTLKGLLSSSTPIDMTIDIPDIMSQVQKMSDLLTHHLIAIDENKVILCILNNIDNFGKVQVAIAKKPL